MRNSMAGSAKQSVIFLPGLLCDGSFWREQIEALADAADCFSMEWTGEDSLSAMAEAALRRAPERFSVAGHSMGGRIALEVYRLAPERVERIALLNTGYQAAPPGPAREQEERQRYALLNIAREQSMQAMARQWLPPMIHPARLQDQALVERIVEMFARKTPEIFAAQIRALLNRPDRSALLEQIQCPALLIAGRDDGWSPPDRHADMAAKIPHSKLVVIPECGHMSPLERPKEVAEALRRWLAEPTHRQ